MKKLSALIAGFAIFFSVFSYAEDSLNSFQQEIVYAKQKQQGISQKMDSVNLTLDKEKTVLLEQEAQGLITELTHDGYKQGPKEIKFVPSSAQFQKSPPPIAAKTAAEKPKTKKGWLFSAYKEPKVSEAQLIYKVAISDGVISVEDAVKIGLASNLQAKAAAAKVTVAKAKLTEAKRALFPTLQAVAILPNSSGGKQPASAGTQPTPRTFRTQSYKLNATQPLFYGGELVLTVKQAAENIKSVEAEYEKIKNEFIQQTRSVYYATVKAEYNVQYEIELYSQTNVVYKRILEAHREKLVPEVDYLNVESQYHQVFFQMESANNDLLSANITLAQTIGLDLKEPLPLDLKLDFKKIDLNFEDLLEQGYVHNPDLKAKTFALESAKYGVEVYAAKKRPHFDLRGSYGKVGEAILDDASYSGLVQSATRGIRDEIEINKDKEWFFGVKGSMPLGPNSAEWEQIKHVYAPSVISPNSGSEDWNQKVTFNFFDKFAEITDEKSARGALMQAEADLGKTKNELTLKIREDYYNMQKSLIQIDAAVAKIHYQEKQNSILEYLVGLQESQPANLIEGYIELVQSKFSFIQAVVDYNLASSSLGVSLGDPDTFFKKGNKPT